MALVAFPGARPDDGAAGRDLDRGEVGDGAELGDGADELLVDRFGRAQRAQQGRDRGARVLAHGLLADVTADLLVAGQLLGDLEQRDRLVVPDPVGNVVEIRGRVAHARALEQRGDRLLARDAAHVAQQRARHRARDLSQGRTVGPSRLGSGGFCAHAASIGGCARTCESNYLKFGLPFPGPSAEIRRRAPRARPNQLESGVRGYPAPRWRFRTPSPTPRRW